MPHDDTGPEEGRRIDTAFGPALLDLSRPGQVRARAGQPGGLAPLTVEGRPVAVDIGLAHSPASGRYSLLAEDAPIAWDPSSPATPLPPDLWRRAAEAVLEAAEGFLAAHPGLARTADLAAARARIAEIDASLDAAAEWMAELRAERAHLSDRVDSLRKGMLTQIR